MPYKENDRTAIKCHFMQQLKSQLKIWPMRIQAYTIYQLPFSDFSRFMVLGKTDMAIFKFTKAILDGDKIDVYNLANETRLYYGMTLFMLFIC